MSALKKLVQRISAVNPDAASHISDVMENQGQFLPVLINANGNNSLNQAFMRGLTSALVRDGLDDVIPDNYYTESVKMLLNWQQNFPDTYKLFQRKLNKETIDSFIKKLESYDEKALEFFRAVYPELTSGGMFNPLIDNEVITVYQSVNRILREKHGYAGIYIIFDEFSKYIEGHAVEGFADDMKILQDMCELCNASKDEQLHLTCVAHKSIKTYGAALPAEILNSFKGVEGRLKEVYFVVSSQNNYELISDAISKTPAFDSWAKGNQLYADLIEKSYALKAFSSLFTPGDYNEIVGKGCFPLTPVAAMLLLNLSEKIAQNERTIFTYIASKDANGLARHVEKSKNDKFVGVDSVYDYFVPLFKEEVQVGIHHEWLKADYALSQIKTAVEAAVIKSIAVIRMINNADEITASEKFITLATGLNKADIQIALAHLSDRKLIEFKARTGAYEFKNNVGVDIEQAIADCMKKRFSKADPCSVLANVVKERYILPKKHNQTFCMTRYFNFAYMTYAQYMNLKDLSYLTWPNRPDGVIVMMMPSEEINRAAVEAHTKEISDPCLITCLPNVSVTCDEIAKYYLAVSSLHNNSTFIEDNLVIKKELEKLAEETIIALNEWVKNTYYPLQNIYGMDGPIAIGPKGLNRLVSDICDTAYHFTPRINHELINRHEVTTQVAKARNTNDLRSPNMIYLDNAATTFPKPERVYTALETANRELSFNAGRGSYKAARAASAIIDDTKNRLLSLFHATGYADIVFTPSVTHALNQVLNGLDLTGNSVIYVSPYEHNAVARTVYQLSVNSGASVKMLPLTKDLQIDLEKAKYQFSINSPSVVILNALSNVTGYILPVAEIFLMAKEYGAITVLDAAQAAGLIDLDMPALNADVLCFAGHKTLMGPFGIGGFLIKHGITLKKVLTGGTGSASLTLDMPEEAPGRYEASSTNVVAIAGLNASLKGLDINEHRKTLRELTEYMG